jgi:hypothetical protein
VIFVIAHLLPTIALVILIVIGTRLLLGSRFRRHSWYGGSYGPPRRW